MVIATKALACKLAKAAWHVMAKQSDYDPQRMFAELATQKTENQQNRAGGSTNRDYAFRPAPFGSKSKLGDIGLNKALEPDG